MPELPDQSAPKRLGLIDAAIFALVLIAHWYLQFWAWILADGISPMRLPWWVLGTPLAHLLPTLGDRYFWFIMTANSVLWATVLTWLIHRFGFRRRA